MQQVCHFIVGAATALSGREGGVRCMSAGVALPGEECILQHMSQA